MPLKHENILVMKKLKITKSNAIVNSSYRLSLNELRIVLYGLSHIDPTAKEFPLFHCVNIKELAEFYDIGTKERGSFYDNIKNALINKFWEREFSYFDVKLNKFVKNRWLIQVQYGGKDGTLAYYYNPMIQKQLQQLSCKFTSYFLSNVANMKSIYAIRLYEIAIMYLKASKRQKTVFTKDIENLKQHLDIADKYKYFYHFKARVLETARKEINKSSDIKFSYEIIRHGRAAKEIKFTISYRELKNIQQEKVQLPLLTTKDTNRQLPPLILKKLKEIVVQAGTGWDVRAIIEQFYAFTEKKGLPDDFYAALIGFVKKKVEKYP